MPETQHQEKTDNRVLSRGTWVVVACTLAGNALDKGGYIGFPFGLILAYSIALPIEYWFLPRPRVGYGRFLVTVASYMLIFLAGFWALPRLLEKWLWRPLAYAVPVLILGISTYWLPRLYPAERKRERFWLWSLCVIAFAIFYGWAERG